MYNNKKKMMSKTLEVNFFWQNNAGRTTAGFKTIST